MTFKPGLGFTEGHWKCHHSIECMRLPTDILVIMALSSVVSEIFNVEKCCDLEIRVRGHSRSSKVVPCGFLLVFYSNIIFDFKKNVISFPASPKFTFLFPKGSVEN